MHSVLFRAMLVTSLRDKITLFYSLLLPVVLMFGLGMYFNEPAQQLRIVCGITAVSTLFWGMQGIAFQIHWQRSKGVYKLLMLTPMPLITFIIVMIMARTVIGVAINSVIWLVGMISFRLEFTVLVAVLTFLIIILGTLCFTGIGFVLANMARNEAHINMLSNLQQMPMIFMSSAFYSLSGAPQWVSVVGKAFPFEHYVQLLTNVHLTKSTVSMITLIVLILYIAISVFVSSVTFRWDTNSNQALLKSQRA